MEPQVDQQTRRIMLAVGVVGYSRATTTHDGACGPHKVEAHKSCRPDMGMGSSGTQQIKIIDNKRWTSKGEL